MSSLNVLRSTPFRLALLYMAIFALSVLMLLGFIYWSTEGFLESQIEETVNAEILGLSERYELLGLAGVIHIINERIGNDASRSSLYLLTDMEFNPLAGNLERWPSDVTRDAHAAANKSEEWLHFALSGVGMDDGRDAMAKHIRLKGGFHLLVGRDDTEKVRVEKLIVKSMGWGFALTLVLGIIGGLFMSRGMLRRIDVINRASREIMRGDLSRRIPRLGTNDEFDQLIQNLNDMLDRIENLMDGVKQVSDNIAHDLRSPINRLRGRLEVAMLQKPDMETYRATIEQTIAGTDEVIRTFNALLKIARAEAGLNREEIEEINLVTIARDMVELYEPLAEEKNIRLDTDFGNDVCLPGDRHLLSQAMANLLDNALKYTPEDGVVTVSLSSNRKLATLQVADSGPGIPYAERERVLERFYRLESSRNAPGSGLGLSLVAAVAKLHNADLLLEDNRPGLRVKVVFDLSWLGATSPGHKNP